MSTASGKDAAARLLRTMKVVRRSAKWWIVAKFCPDVGPYDRKQEAVEDLVGLRRTFLNHPEMLADDYGRPVPRQRVILELPRVVTNKNRAAEAGVVGQGDRRRRRRPAPG